jgi:hypothetical protein
MGSEVREEGFDDADQAVARGLDSHQHSFKLVSLLVVGCSAGV